MAKITIKHNIKIGDRVLFTNYSEQILGTVQDISELPELWVETGNLKNDTYKRYRISINQILENYDDDWCDMSINYDKKECIEFAYNDNYERVPLRYA